MTQTLAALPRLASIVLALLLIGTSARAQSTGTPAAVKAAAERITTEQLKQDLEFLASDTLRGRNTPSPGFDAAADYIEARLRRAGVKPLGDAGTYRQHYVMMETTLREDAASMLVGSTSFKHGEGFTLRTFAGDLVTKPVPAVYVGHGWTAPGVDPYRGVTVKGKLLVVHSQAARPKGVEITQRGRVTIGGTSPLVEAQRRGAVGIIYLWSEPAAMTGTPAAAARQPVVRRELDPSVPSAYAAAPLTSIQAGAEATRALLQGTKLDPAALEDVTRAQDYPPSFELPSAVTVRLPATTVAHRPYNVIGLVEGTEPTLKNQYIVLQSHLDGSVGTRTVDDDGIYNSADDNATGSAANLGIAEQMMAVRPRRSIIFVWDSGEEQGLWGTRQFVSRPPVPLSSVVALINIDMIGANRAPGTADAQEERVTGPNEVFVIGPAVLSERANALLERVNDDYLKLSLNRRYDTPESEFFYPRTDAGPFLERGVLTIGFTTGIHNRYHLPADEARFMDPAKIGVIARTIFAYVHALAQVSQRPAIERPLPPTVLRVK